ncbi:MAG TPA: hypothetical protein VFF67_00975 [Thermoplasmata archaeon]|nr:hypothetical protein [Thermoplasmata archaeon]
MNEHASYASCPIPTGQGSGYVSGASDVTDITIAIPVRIPTTGTHVVVANMSAVFTANETVHLGGLCPPVVLNTYGNGQQYCTIQALYYFQQNYAYIDDKTTNTWISPTGAQSGPLLWGESYGYNDTTCSSNSCSYSNYSLRNTTTLVGNAVNTSWDMAFNTTFTATHHYLLLLSFNIEAGGEIQGYPKTTAVTWINVATFGNHFGVNFVSVS